MVRWLNGQIVKWLNGERGAAERVPGSGFGVQGWGFGDQLTAVSFQPMVASGSVRAGRTNSRPTSEWWLKGRYAAYDRGHNTTRSITPRTIGTTSRP